MSQEDKRATTLKLTLPSKRVIGLNTTLEGVTIDELVKINIFLEESLQEGIEFLFPNEEHQTNSDVYKFIDYGYIKGHHAKEHLGDELYARLMFEHFLRVPSFSAKMENSEFYRGKELFATYRKSKFTNPITVKVVDASRTGLVMITTDFKSNQYEDLVSIDTLSNFSRKPPTIKAKIVYVGDKK